MDGYREPMTEIETNQETEWVTAAEVSGFNLFGQIETGPLNVLMCPLTDVLLTSQFFLLLSQMRLARGN